MTNEIIKMSEAASEHAQLEKDFKPLLDAFQGKLNTKPDQRIVKTFKGAKYIPIEIMEAIMDKYFAGAWEIANLKYSIELNAVVVSLDVRFFHPIRHTWVTRSGIGSVPVQLNRGEKAIGPDTIKGDALQKNLPAAKSIAFKNACQSIGRAMGRNLNRRDDPGYQSDDENFSHIKV